MALLVAAPAPATIIVEPRCTGLVDGVQCATACTGARYGLCWQGQCRGDAYSNGVACAPAERGAAWYETVGRCNALGLCVPPATGDCDGDGRVTIAELVAGVDALLEGDEPCAGFSRGDFGVAQLVAAVGAALGE